MIMVRTIVGMAFSLLLSLGQFAGATELAGRVVGITDGDTLTLLYEGNQQVRIRLAEIDAPESRQPYGNRARQELSDLAFGKDVTVTVQDIDRYGRTVGRVYDGSLDVNAEMVRQGAAWVYRQYSHDPLLLRHEQDARDARRGLWALPEAEHMPPWEWRTAERGGQGRSQPTATIVPTSGNAASSSFACAGKRYCREMTSCAEARFYLTQCGVRSLDGDHDGMPCERICR
jgi:endonuclease YncB( thermonuclease family)